MSEHAILLDWDHEPELAVVFETEDKLRTVLTLHPGLGEVDGNEIGSGTVRIYLYGPNCETLWEVIAPTVTSLADPPVTVTLRPGGPGTPARIVTA